MKRFLAALIVAIALAVSACQPVLAADFRPALYEVVLPNEGGWANNPKDSGGETFKGIARRYNPKWSGWGEIDRLKRQMPTQPRFGSAAYYGWVRKLNWLLKESPAVDACVERFYRVNFWDAFRLGDCRLQTTADRWLDSLVNNGPLAAKWMKRAINRTAHRRVVDDSTTRVTTYTISQLNLLPQDRVLFWFAVYRGARYDALAEKNSSFVDVWADRTIREIVTAVHDRDRLMGVRK